MAVKNTNGKEVNNKPNVTTVTPKKEVSETKEDFTPQQIVKALKATEGMVSLAAKTLGCSRMTIYRYKEKYPEVAEAMTDAKELMIDVAEGKLHQAVKKGEAWAICFYLKTQARSRGYVEKQEIEHAGKNGGPIEIKAIDYRTAITALAPGSVGDSTTSC